MSIRSFITSTAKAVVKAGKIAAVQINNIAENRDEIAGCIVKMASMQAEIQVSLIDLVADSKAAIDVLRTIGEATGERIATANKIGSDAMDVLVGLVNKGIVGEGGAVDGGEGEGAVGEGGQGGEGGAVDGGAVGEGGQGGEGDADLAGWDAVGGLQGDEGEGGLTWDQNPRLRAIVQIASSLKEDMVELAELHEFELIVVPTVAGVIKASKYVAYQLRKEGYKVAADKIKGRGEYLETYSEGLHNNQAV